MKFGKSKIFFLFCLSFIAGVFLGKYVNIFVMAILAMAFIIFVTVFWQKRIVRLVGFLGLILVCGAWRFQGSSLEGKPNFVGQLYNQKVELGGVVVKEPDVRSNKIYLTLKIQGYEGKILVSSGRYPEYQYGDRLKIAGLLEEPFESEEFSYKNYLSRYEVYAVMRYPKIEKLAENQGNKIVAALLGVKHKFQEILSQILPEPHNALALGLFLGAKRSLPEDLKNALIAVGVSHIVVVSGYNISIITRNLLRTRAWLGRRVAFWLSLFAVLAFVVMTGGEASVIRAAVMGLMVVFALNIGRIYYPVNALVFVAAVMLVQNPRILHFDIGFQLSFLATLGLIYLAPIFEKWFDFLPEFLSFRSNLASSAAAQVFVLPLLIFHFERISLLALPVNVLILWVIPYAMFFGFFATVLGIIYLPFGQILGILIWAFLEYLIRVVDFFSHISVALISFQTYLGVLILYYLVLVFWLLWYRKTREFSYYLEFIKMRL